MASKNNLCIDFIHNCLQFTSPFERALVLTRRETGETVVILRESFFCLANAFAYQMMQFLYGNE